MSSDDALIPIRNTLGALDRIQERLFPHLQTLRQSRLSAADNNISMAIQSEERHAKAEAQAAIALTLGTLHYMNAKLHGATQAKVELHKTRQLIEALRKVDPRTRDKTGVTETKTVPYNCTKETSVESAEDESNTFQEGNKKEREEVSVEATNMSSSDTLLKNDISTVRKMKKRKR